MKPFRQALAMALLASTAAFAASPGPGFTLREATADTWTVVYTPHLPAPKTISIGQEQFLLYDGPSDSAAEGCPQLPVDLLSLGIPFGSSVSAELADAVYETVPDQRVAPVPSYRMNDNQEATAEYAIDPAVYGANAWFPAAGIVAGEPFTFREQRVCPLRIHPVQYNPALRLVRRLVRAAIKIRLSGASLPVLQAAARPDPLGESAYRTLIWNFEQAKQWRRAQAPAMSILGGGEEHSRVWFDPAAQYLRIPIARDGWYRADAQTFAAAGVSWSAINLSTLRVLQKGEELPVFLEGDTACSFYAKRNYGDSTYDDFFTDTSTCWLTWGGDRGIRYAPVSAPQGNPSVVTSVPTTIHVEQNLSYFMGTGYDEITNTETVKGEGWVWDYYYPNNVLSHTFSVDVIDTSGSVPVQFRGRLFSTTLHKNTPDHIAKFFLNDSLAGQVSFDGRTGVTPVFSLSGRWLLNGQNRMKIQSVPTLTTVNQFYLDWFEVTYRRRLAAVADQLVFDAPQDSSTAVHQYRVGGFTSPDLLAFDLTGSRQIMPDSVVADQAGTWTLVFSDSAAATRRYLTVSRNAALGVPSATRKTWADLRTGGADYIVITHGLFRAAAERLAAQRGSTRGIRTRVVDVQDIYDEFNYGIVSDHAIKDFLRYAYANWSAPAPSSVVFLGDASWDPHRYLTSSVKTNFIPAHGVPSGDNWFGCFDSTITWVPSLLIGRLPVTSAGQADMTVTKLLTYETTPRGTWNKTFMFITAGDTQAEKDDFNARSDRLITLYVTPPPLGCATVRAYKTSPAVIDGSMKPFLQQTIKNGLLFISYIGHSGGRVWSLDAGSPYDLENTNGWWPFVISVSCNVGAFAEPSSNVLAEDFLLAENRGAIAAWASASLGYPTHGSLLEEYFLNHMRVDSVRAFGDLTTAARIKLWEMTGRGYITIAHQFLTPLIGDPLSEFVLPRIPDLALQASDVESDPVLPTAADSTVHLNVRVHNYGTTPAAPGIVSGTDTYNGIQRAVDTAMVAPVALIDSVTLAWHAGGQAGQHTLDLRLALPDSLQDMSMANNEVMVGKYVYANALQVLRPLGGAVVPGGPVHLVVSSENGVIPSAFHYVFELDTVPTFDSPAKITSPDITPGAISGEWTTPALPAGEEYYWRTRTVSASTLGRWVGASFMTASSVPPTPLLRWTQKMPQQFNQDRLSGVVATDSGVGITPGSSMKLFCRSLGNRADANRDFYSIIKVGLDVIYGLWWQLGNSFMVVRVSPLNGTYEFRSFAVSDTAALADSMAAYLNRTADGMYLGICVIKNGQTNVNTNLKNAMAAIGAQKAGSILSGMSYALLARKGYPSAALEALTNDSAVVSLDLPIYYRTGRGSLTSTAIPKPYRWDSFHWKNVTQPGVSTVSATILGTRADGRTDTLKVISPDSADVSLLDLNSTRSLYDAYHFVADLRTVDGAITPRLLEWSADLEPPADLALAVPPTGSGELVVPRGMALDLPVSLYNLGYRRTDSARVTVGVFDGKNLLQPILEVGTGAVPVDSSLALSLHIPTDMLAHNAVLQIAAAPCDSSGDLFPGNSAMPFQLMVTGAPQGVVDFLADGVRVMDGDYLVPRPKLLIESHGVPPVNVVSTSTGLLVDGQPMGSGTVGTPYSPSLTDGRHQLRALVLYHYTTGTVDTVQRTILVNVESDLKIKNLFNYPNPFAHQTEFTFQLTTVPEAVTIRVYTVAGRKIREIVVPADQAGAGFNRIPWDGRDNDGDDVANGLYFYQVQVSAAGKTETAIGKLVRVR